MVSFQISLTIFKSFSRLDFSIILDYKYKLSLFIVEKDWLLSEYSKNLNPFSIMRADEPINFGTLLFKIIIAYLIYQLIISIRQNTRRK